MIAVAVIQNRLTIVLMPVALLILVVAILSRLITVLTQVVLQIHVAVTLNK